jgi:hypothetical protein
MRRVIVSYKAKPDCVEEHEALIRAVYDEPLLTVELLAVGVYGFQLSDIARVLTRG